MASHTVGGVRSRPHPGTRGESNSYATLTLEVSPRARRTVIYETAVLKLSRLFYPADGIVKRRSELRMLKNRARPFGLRDAIVTADEC